MQAAILLIHRANDPATLQSAPFFRNAFPFVMNSRAVGDSLISSITPARVWGLLRGSSPRNRKVQGALLFQALAAVWGLRSEASEQKTHDAMAVMGFA